MSVILSKPWIIAFVTLFIAGFAFKLTASADGKIRIWSGVNVDASKYCYQGVIVDGGPHNMCSANFDAAKREFDVYTASVIDSKFNNETLSVNRLVQREVAAAMARTTPRLTNRAKAELESEILADDAFIALLAKRVKGKINRR